MRANRDGLLTEEGKAGRLTYGRSLSRRQSLKKTSVSSVSLRVLRASSSLERNYPPR
jgi:hypothetical protein